MLQINPNLVLSGGAYRRLENRLFMAKITCAAADERIILYNWFLYLPKMGFS